MIIIKRQMRTPAEPMVIGDENFYCACAEPRTPKERGEDNANDTK